MFPSLVTLARGLAAIAGCLLILTCLSAATIPADSRITSVTVYETGAVVTREATVQLESGQQVVRFPNLPRDLDENLLQVSGRGTASVTILEAVAASSQLTAPANPRLRELQDELRGVQEKQQDLADQLGVVQQQRDYLERIKVLTTTPPGGDAAPLPAPEQWDQLLSFYAERQGRVAIELRRLGRQREELAQQASAVERQIEELEAPDAEEVKHVFVRCDVSRPGELTLRLSYHVDDADWSPVYDLRVTSADKSIALGYGAIVRQSTGEDWKDVKLLLSTADPDLDSTPPNLDAWMLQEQQPVQVVTSQFMRDSGATDSAALLQYTTSTATGSVYGNFAGMGQDELQSIEVEAAPSAEVASGLTSTTFTIPFAVDVPADNFGHRVAIHTLALTGVMNHLAIPKLTDHAYLRARVTNSSPHPFVAGEASLFLDGTFVSRSRLPLVMPGAKFILNLGADAGIAVERKVINRLTENTGAFAKRARITYDTRLIVENNRTTAETVIVKDQVPISRHEKIVVTLVEPAKTEISQVDEAGADGTIRRAEDGTLSWTVKLKPGERRELPLKLTVEYPTDFAIMGLE